MNTPGTIAEQLRRLQYHPDGPDRLEQVERLEQLIGVPLPPDYRRFLLETGGGYLRDATADCTVPTPFAACNVTRMHSASEVINLLDSDRTPRNMICVGSGHFGMTTCLSVAGLDHGQVFALDTQMRFFWGQDTIALYPDLAPSIREFFRLRDADALPSRPWGYDNCYHLADSFESFLGKLGVADRK